MNEFFAALAGAIVGGVMTGSVAIWQTRKTLGHSTDLSREAAAEERRAARDALTRQAAVAMLTALATYSTPVGRGARAHWFGGVMTELERAGVHSRVAELARHSIASAPLLPQRAAGRWHHLVQLAQTLNHRDTSDLPQFRRMVGDVENYAEYVRQTLAAVVDDQELPSDAAPPVLNRDDSRVWSYELALLSGAPEAESGASAT